ncbi:MAG: hypothetical protein R3F56_11030 [Planctomycetota bacterium]
MPSRILAAAFFSLSCVLSPAWARCEIAPPQHPNTPAARSGFADAEETAAPLEAHYTVAARDAKGESGVIPLHLTLEVTNPPSTRTVVAIPVWTPGSYRLRPFPQHVHDLVADDGAGNELAVQRLDAQTWQIQHDRVARLRLRYRVDLHDDDRFMLRGDRRRCITYEGPAVYLYLRDHLRVPCYVRFEVPADWRVGSGLPHLEDGRYFAPDYDVLADCPVKLGQFQTFSFESHGQQVDVIVDGPGDVDFDSGAWVGNIEKVVDATGAMFGGLPFRRYAFLFTASPGGGGGGLEHLYSTCIGVPVAQLRRSAMAAMPTIAHEFFHTFNVKRLRPVELGPFDYSRPNRSQWLWLMEGVTSYYEQVLLARAGLLTDEAFWRAAARKITVFEAMPGRAHTSSARASELVWDDVPVDRRLDYYTSGEVLGLLLDLEIRARTDNRSSLDDVMRALYRTCIDRGRGFADDEVATTVSSIARCDMREWFDMHVFGTVVPDYARILGFADLAYTESVSTELELRGLQRLGKDAGYCDPDAVPRGRIDLRAGVVTAVDGEAVDGYDAVSAVVDGKAAGDVLRLRLRTLTGEVEVNARVQERVRRRVRVQASETPSPGALAIRRGITGG